MLNKWKLNWKHKFNINLIVTPKVFWPIIGVLLGVNITLYTLKEEEKNLRIYTHDRLSKIIEDKERIIKVSLNKLEKEITARREIEAQLIITMRERGIFERDSRRVSYPLEKGVPKKSLAVPPLTFEPIDLGGIVVNNSGRLIGRILSVNREYDWIIVNLGENDNLKLKDALSVYQNGKFVGGLQVEKVEKGVCAAVVLPEWGNVEFKENDEVRIWGV